MEQKNRHSHIRKKRGLRTDVAAALCAAALCMAMTACGAQGTQDSQPAAGPAGNVSPGTQAADSTGGSSSGAEDATDSSGTQDAANPSEESPSGAQEKQLVKVEVDLSGYESYWLGCNGVLTVKKDGLWGAVNYQNEVIVPFAYNGIQSMDDQGNLVMWTRPENSWQSVYTVYDSEGNLLYQSEESERVSKVIISGGMYMVLAESDTPNSFGYCDYKITYYKLDGTLVSTVEGIPPMTAYVHGFYDGVSTVYNGLTGEVDQQGAVTWHENPPITSELEESDGYGYPVSTANHGYVLTLKFPTSHGYSMVGEKYQRWWNLNGVLGMGNTLRSFYHDGDWYYNYGPNVVWTVKGQEGKGDRDVLVDITLDPAFTGLSKEDRVALMQSGYDDIENSAMKGIVKAVYDRIYMDNEKYWAAQKGDMRGYIDHDGKEVAMYESASSFCGGYAVVVEEGTAYLINEQFEKLQELGAADNAFLLGTLFKVNKDGAATLYRFEK